NYTLLERAQHRDAESLVGAALREADEEVGLHARRAIGAVIPEHGQLALRRAARRDALAPVEARADAVARADLGARADPGIKNVVELPEIGVAEERVAHVGEHRDPFVRLVH